MWMKSLVAASIVAAGVSAHAQTAPAGDVEAGKKAWDVALRCQNCHGLRAEGGFGPDLAGRGLSLDQFRRAVRQPWGIMPAYAGQQLSDQAIADMWAYTSSLPKVLEPAHPRCTAPRGAPAGQVYAVDSLGCANCHGPELRNPRRVLGGEAGEFDFEHFETIVYEHHTVYPAGRMGSYSRTRAPEAVLHDIYDFMTKDLGLMAPIVTSWAPASAQAGGGARYTLTIRNTGTVAKGGLAAEEVTVTLRLPDGATVTQGNQPTVTAKGGVALWTIARIAPQDVLTYTVAVPDASRPVAALIAGSRVDWLKPAMRSRAPDLALVDDRLLGSRNDWQPINAVAGPVALSQCAPQAGN